MWTTGDGPRRPEREQQVVRMSDALAGVRPRSRTNCLERSLLAYRFLAQVNAQPRLIVGVHRQPNADVVGHAWVEVDGRAVHESETDLHDFVPLVEFGRGNTGGAGVSADVLPDRWE